MTAEAVMYWGKVISVLKEPYQTTVNDFSSDLYRIFKKEKAL